MGIWLQRGGPDSVETARAARVGLACLGAALLDGLQGFFRSPVPPVDGLLVPNGCTTGRLEAPFHRMPKKTSWQEIAAGRPPGAFSAFDFVLCLRDGESLLVGNETGLIRQAAQRTNGSCLMPVHYPLRSGLTLLSLEQRWVSPRAGPSGPDGFVGIPIEGALPPADGPAPRAETAAGLLRRAVRSICTGDREAGFAMLAHLYAQTVERSPHMAGLAVRNGLAAALHAGADQRAEWWAARGEAACSDYAEFRLMSSLIPYFRGDREGAIRQLSQCLDLPERSPGTPFIGGGGESSYRALTFRGIALAELGDLKRAVEDWTTALHRNPDFLLPLELLSRYALHAQLLDRIGLGRHLPERSSRARVLVADAYARSSTPEVAAEILRHASPPDLTAPEAVEVHWEGPIFTMSSLARVNRELALRLSESGVRLAAWPTEPSGYDPAGESRFRPLTERLGRRSGPPAVTVRHLWPPFFGSVRSGRLVIYVPWEYGPVPRAWVNHLQQADEIWVYSGWVRDGLTGSGVDPVRIRVVPCGVDTRVFHPGAAGAGPAADGDDFQFLYVGGTIPRKGYDLALQAFLSEFAPDEFVTLRVKDFGGHSFYRDSTGLALVRAAASATAGLRRRVQLIDEVLTDRALASLYRSADCLVAPYRAEGFCMPALEAMACGTPALLPRFGPALDYATPATALLVDADTVPMGRWIEGMRLAGEAVVCEIPLPSLRERMRWAFEHRRELADIGQRATADVHARFTWDHAAEIASERVRALTRV